jgi:hypothetical protein
LTSDDVVLTSDDVVSVSDDVLSGLNLSVAVVRVARARGQE